jgi:hypothetical protein
MLASFADYCECSELRPGLFILPLVVCFHETLIMMTITYDCNADDVVSKLANDLKYRFCHAQ